MTVSLEQVSISLDELADKIDLVGQLREQNERFAHQRPCWALMSAQVSLVTGVAGDVGVLAWCGADAVDGMDLSSGGSNAGPVDYWMGGLYPQPFPAGCEVPIEQVFTAVREFVTTGSKPPSVRWQPERAAWHPSTD